MSFRSLAVAVLLAAGTAANAQDKPVEPLQNLKGAKGASVETSLTNQGYVFQGRGTGPRASTEYWRESKTNACVAVRYRNNSVIAVVQATDADCLKAAANKPAAPAPTATGFATVCGVTADNKPYRYKCTVEGAAPGGPGSTILHFPDNKVTLTWQGASRASALFEGMVPKDVTVTTTEGMTSFTFDGKPYFYVSDRAKAPLELKSLK